jgi:hypothetical protein
MMLECARSGGLYGTASVEAEISDIIRDALKEESQLGVGLGTEIAALFKGIGLQEGEEIHELRGYSIKSYAPISRPRHRRAACDNHRLK